MGLTTSEALSNMLDALPNAADALVRALGAAGRDARGLDRQDHARPRHRHAQAAAPVRGGEAPRRRRSRSSSRSSSSSSRPCSWSCSARPSTPSRHRSEADVSRLLVTGLFVLAALVGGLQAVGSFGALLAEPALAFVGGCGLFGSQDRGRRGIQRLRPRPSAVASAIPRPGRLRGVRDCDRRRDRAAGPVRLGSDIARHGGRAGDARLLRLAAASRCSRSGVASACCPRSAGSSRAGPTGSSVTPSTSVSSAPAPVSCSPSPTAGTSAWRPPSLRRRRRGCGSRSAPCSRRSRNTPTTPRGRRASCFGCAASRIVPPRAGGALIVALACRGPVWSPSRSRCRD